MHGQECRSYEENLPMDKNFNPYSSNKFLKVPFALTVLHSSVLESLLAI